MSIFRKKETVTATAQEEKVEFILGDFVFKPFGCEGYALKLNDGRIWKMHDLTPREGTVEQNFKLIKYLLSHKSEIENKYGINLTVNTIITKDGINKDLTNPILNSEDTYTLRKIVDENFTYELSFFLTIPLISIVYKDLVDIAKKEKEEREETARRIKEQADNEFEARLNNILWNENII